MQIKDQTEAYKIQYALQQKEYFKANKDFEASFYGEAKGKFNNKGLYPVVFNYFIGTNFSKESANDYRNNALAYLNKNNIPLDSEHKIKGFMSLFMLIDYFKNN